MKRFKGKGFTLVELLVVISIIGLLLAILFPALSAAMKTANQMKCGANLRSIGQAIKIYSSQNRGHWPTVYSYNSTIVDETWGETFTDESMALADRGTVAGQKLKERTTHFQDNISAWWILVRAGMASAPVFVCPRTSMDPDTTQEPTLWWSFEKIGNVSYSYQNQLRATSAGAATPGQYNGGNTNDNCDGQVVVAADRNPQREDVSDVPTGTTGTDKYNWNSPNHDFEGQNCLFADGHVEFNTDPYCGFGKNNIWIKSIYTAATSSGTSGTWDDADGMTTAPAGASSYQDKKTTCGNKNDSYLVP